VKECVTLALWKSDYRPRRLSQRFSHHQRTEVGKLTFRQRFLLCLVGVRERVCLGTPGYDWRWRESLVYDVTMEPPECALESYTEIVAERALR
jgi:hypothetical protein